MPEKGKSNIYSMVGILKVMILALLALVVGVLSVSFASHHMRMGYESEYVTRLEKEIQSIASLSAKSISGDDIVANPQFAAQKYESVLQAMILKNNGEVSQNTKLYAIYAYNNGTLTSLCKNAADNNLRTPQLPPSEWINNAPGPSFFKVDQMMTVLTPIRNSDGAIVGVYELSCTYFFLDSLGNSIERRTLIGSFTVLIIALSIYSLHYVIPTVISVISGFRKKRG